MAGLGQLLKNLSKAAPGAQTRGETLKAVLPMAGINFGLGMLSGNPVEALAYGAGDLLLNYPALRLAQRLSPGQRVTKIDPKTGKKLASNVYEPSGLETAVNFGGSFGSNLLVGSLLQPKEQQVQQAQQFLAQQAQQVNPALQSQPAQISQQNLQRNLINQMVSEQMLAPGTMYQLQGAEQTNKQSHYPGVTLPPDLLALIQEGGMTV